MISWFPQSGLFFLVLPQQDNIQVLLHFFLLKPFIYKVYVYFTIYISFFLLKEQLSVTLLSKLCTTQTRPWFCQLVICIGMSSVMKMLTYNKYLLLSTCTTSTFPCIVKLDASTSRLGPTEAAELSKIMKYRTHGLLMSLPRKLQLYH